MTAALLRNSVLLVIALILLAVTTEAEFRMKSLVTVGRIYENMTPPMCWSPDGSRIALFFNGSLLISDSTGTRQPVASLRGVPSAMVWSSDSTVLMRTVYHWWKEAYEEHLIVVNVMTGIINRLEYRRLESVSTFGVPEPRTFAGPFVSIEGQPYYQTFTSTDTTTIVVHGASGRLASASDGTILVKADSAVYRQSLDGRSRSQISRAAWSQYFHPQINLQGSHITVHCDIRRLPDSLIAILDTLPLARVVPPDMDSGVGCTEKAFHPVLPEIAFTFLSGAHPPSHAYRLVVYDYQTHTLTRVDSLVGLSEGFAPVWSPDGRRLAFVANRVLYIMERE